MAIGNTPGDTLATAVVDLVTNTLAAGSLGVSAVTRIGSNAILIDLTSPAAADQVMCVCEFEGGGAAVTIAAQPLSDTRWLIDWASVPSATTPGGGYGAVQVNAGGSFGGVTPGPAGSVLTSNGPGTPSFNALPVETITDAAPVIVTSAGSTFVVGFIPGTAPGDLLTWNGAAWLPTAPAPAAAPVTFPINVSHNNPTPLYGPAVYLNSNATAPSSALFYLPNAGDVGAFHIANSLGLLVSTWNTPAAIGPGYYEAFPGGFVGLAPGWYVFGVSKVVGPGSVDLLGVRFVP